MLKEVSLHNLLQNDGTNVLFTMFTIDEDVTTSKHLLLFYIWAIVGYSVCVEKQ